MTRSPGCHPGPSCLPVVRPSKSNYRRNRTTAQPLYDLPDLRARKILIPAQGSPLIEGMEQVNRDRWNFLMRVLAEGPGLSQVEVLKHAGVSRGIARKDYEYTLQPATCQPVVDVAAPRLGVDPAQLTTWLAGKPEPSVQQHLETLLQFVQCNGPTCGGWFTPAQMVPRSGLCRRCARLKARPDVAAWENQVRDLMAACSDTDLLRGWQVVSSDPQNAITHSRMAKAAGVADAEWVRRWKAAGFPQKKLRLAGSDGKDRKTVAQAAFRKALRHRRSKKDRHLSPSQPGVASEATGRAA